MLVLSRKPNESITIDDAIVITVIDIRGDRVRLGIEAPREVPICRGELYVAVNEQPQDSADDAQDGPPNDAPPA